MWIKIILMIKNVNSFKFTYNLSIFILFFFLRFFNRDHIIFNKYIKTVNLV